MRVATLASNFIRMPPSPHDVPSGYSGAAEAVVYRLTKALVQKGLHVTLFASGDSSTTAKLVSVVPRAVSKDKTLKDIPAHYLEYLQISKCYEMAAQGKFDIIHSHLDNRSVFFAPLVHVPTVSTLHSPLDGGKTILKHFKQSQYYVSISNAQRLPIPDLKYAATIYHGLDLSTFPFSYTDGHGLLYVGRIIPVKGTDVAIKVAKNAGMKLMLLGWAAKQNIK